MARGALYPRTLVLGFSTAEAAAQPPGAGEQACICSSLGKVAAFLGQRWGGRQVLPWASDQEAEGKGKAICQEELRKARGEGGGVAWQAGTVLSL